MKISRFWAKEIGHADSRYGETYRLVSWSGSNKSLEEAKKNALEKIERWRERLTGDGSLQDHYPYDLDGEIREELIEEILDNSGTLIGAITRNRYGALILNSPDVMFIDVDLPSIPRKRINLLSKIIGLFKAPEAQTTELDLKNQFLQKFAAFQQDHVDLSLRVYETAAGYRLVVLNKTFNPLDQETHAIFQKTGADKLYQQLCKAQQCFRARLTPKPWRLGLKQPPYPFPRERSEQQASFERWLDTYQKKSVNLSVCRTVEDLGRATTTEGIEQIINLHDQYVLGSDTTRLY